MTVDELVDCVRDVCIEIDYEPITTCPADPMSFEDSSRTFLGYEACNTNVIGKDDYRGLRALCFK